MVWTATSLKEPFVDYTKFKPLLAVNVDFDKLRFPVLGSPKLDGVRCIMLNGKFVSRTLKPISNNFVRTEMEKLGKVLNLVDGEGVVGDPCIKGSMQRSTSGIMSEDGEPAFTWHVFDAINDAPFIKRWQSLDFVNSFQRVTRIPQTMLYNMQQLEEFVERNIRQGYEGTVLRDPEGRYKFGRSTVKEGLLLRIKQFEDSEATIIGFIEQMQNDNPAEKDALGHTKRSSHKENLVPTGMLGALIIQSLEYPTPFNLGTGFDDALRLEIWNNQSKYLGKIVKFQHQPYGQKNLPRILSFIGFRDPSDLGSETDTGG